ncbi:MAG: Sfum_1244 family protein [Thiohalomonadaceae bacterium]
MTPEFSRLRASVQHNCHISDALFARDYSLCIYLLKMREYFRWERGIGYGDSLPDKELGEWLVAREHLWHELEDAEFAPVPFAGRELDPFASEELNALLTPEGLVYSGGYGSSAKPHFFLADLQRMEVLDGLRVFVAGREYARDITAPPAMSIGAAVFVRRESLQRTLWERLEEWRWHKRDNAMGRAVGHYDFEGDFSAALEAMTEHEIDTVILHERGEVETGRRLGPGWEQLLAGVFRTRLEYTARAVRDHLADCLVTLPALLARNAAPSIHFFFANLTGMRRALFPALVRAYEAWHGGDESALPRAVADGRDHWEDVALRFLAAFERDGQKALEAEARSIEF